MKQWIAIVRWMLICSLWCVMIGCSSYVKPQAGDPAMHEIQDTLQQGVAQNRSIATQKDSGLPSDVNEALLPQLQVQAPDENSVDARRFDLSVKNVPAATFFAGLIKGTKYNMVVSPKVEGTITLDLKNVTIEEALNAVRDNYGYQYQRTAYGYHILPDDLQTRVFTVNYLDVNRSGQSKTTISSGQITQTIHGGSSSSTSTSGTSSGTTTSSLQNSSSIDTSTKLDFWTKLQSTLEAIVGDKDGRKVIVNSDAGIVIVHGSANDLEEVARYLDSIQAIMTRQVILEAKVLEVQLNHDFQSGVNWNVLGLEQKGMNPVGDTSNNFDLSDNLKGLFPNIFALETSAGDAFSALIRLLSSQGNVQVLSSPQVSTLNNTQAVIKVGQDEFFITNISSTTTPTTTNPETQQDVELTPFFSGIALDVTPQISGENDVILHIHPIISAVEDQEKTFVVNDKQQELPLAISKIRESDSIVRAKSGQLVVIGGLMTNSTKEYSGDTPGLSKVPLVGSLFKRTNQTSEKSELIILLRPIVVSNHTWVEQASKLRGHTGQLNRGFHYGAHPEIFGNTAE